MLIGISYFTSGPRHIFNASDSNNPSRDSLSVNDAIEKFIKYCQPIFLKSAIGSDMSDLVEERLKKIEEGEYESSGIDILIDKLKDPFADFVFFTIMKNSNEQATITGMVRLKCANEYVSPTPVLVNAWNSMVNGLNCFLEWVVSKECPYKVKIDSNMLIPINTLNI